MMGGSVSCEESLGTSSLHDRPRMTLHDSGISPKRPDQEPLRPRKLRDLPYSDEPSVAHNLSVGGIPMEMVGINFGCPHQSTKGAESIVFVFFLDVSEAGRNQTDYFVFSLTGHGSGQPWKSRQNGFDDNDSNDDGFRGSYGHRHHRHQCHPRSNSDHHLCRTILGAKAHGSGMGPR